MNESLFESFRWTVAPEFKVVQTGENTISIQGVAVKAGDISRNKRKYVDEELKMAARTWIGAPVTINHSPWSKAHPMYDGAKVAGNVRWMEYEDGAMEYIIDVKKQPYVDMIRNHSDDVKGVSIEADYIYNRCIHCKKKFYTTEEFNHHMRNEEHIQNFNYEPHQMLGRAVSLVISPEEPGIAGNPAQLREQYDPSKYKDFSQLLETVTKEKKEVIEYMKKTKGKAVLTPESRQVYDKQLTEQKTKESIENPLTPDVAQGLQPATHNPEDGKAECGEGFHIDDETNECIPDEMPEVNITDPEPPATKSTTETVCADGFILDPSDPQNETCILAPLPATTPPVDAPKIVPEPAITIPKVDVPTPAPASTSATETVADVDNPMVPQLAQGLEPTPHPVGAPKPNCLPGSHWDAEINTCIPDELPEVNITVPAEIPVKTSIESLPAKLRLGEPFANYSDHADCVSKNQNKEDPDAYCAGIKQKTEGDSAEEIKETANIYESQKKIKEMLKRVGVKAYTRDVKLAETMNKINTAMAKIIVDGRGTKTVIKELAKGMLTEAKLRHAYDRGTAKQVFDQLGKVSKADLTRSQTVTKTQKQLSESLQATVTEFNKALKETAEATGGRITSVDKNFATFKKAVGNLATSLAKANKTNAQQGKVIETLKRTAIGTRNLALEWKKDFEKVLSVANKKVTELEKYNKTLEQWKKAKEQEDEAKPEPCPEGQHRDADNKCVPNEPTATEASLKEMVTRLDNLEHKQKGNFKGQAPKQVQETTGKDEYFEDPLKKKPKKRGK